MNENSNGSSQEKPAIRPAILADEWILRYYASCIRKILVGLTGSAYGAIVIGPKNPEMETVLYPSVEHVEYPEIKLRLFTRTNRQILLDKLSDNKPTVLHGFWRAM